MIPQQGHLTVNDLVGRLDAAASTSGSSCSDIDCQGHVHHMRDASMAIGSGLSTSYGTPVSNTSPALSRQRSSQSYTCRVLSSDDITTAVRAQSLSRSASAPDNVRACGSSSIPATAMRAFLLGAGQVITGSVTTAVFLQEQIWRPTAALGRFLALQMALGTRHTGGALGSALVCAVCFPFRRRRKLTHLFHQHELPSISSATNERITLRSCSNCHFKLEYVSRSRVILKDLRDCEVMLVGCSQIDFIILNCDNLHVKELGSGSMGDFTRRKCRNFVHEVVCLRCACQPLLPTGSTAAAGEPKWAASLAVDASVCL